MQQTPESNSQRNSFGEKLNAALKVGTKFFGRSSGIPMEPQAATPTKIDPHTFRTMNEVLEAIPPQVPDVFKEQAKIAADFVTRLDRGEPLADPKLGLFVDQLAHTGFRYSVYVHHQYHFGEPGPDPKVALPVWLQNEYLQAKGIFRGQGSLKETDQPIVQSLFDKWVSNMDYRVGPNGTYFVLDASKSQVPKARNFKCYVEGIDLLEALQQGKLPALFKNLEQLGVNPNEMKLFEAGRLVLYYFKDINIAEGIRTTFDRNKVHFRGPAQDVDEVNIDKQGNLKVEVANSNDGALGEGGHSVIDYKVQKYAPTAFLDNYLQLCLWAGKNPSEPYKTSFVYFEDWEGRAKKGNLNGLIKKASEMVQYPVLYTPHRLDVARK